MLITKDVTAIILSGGQGSRMAGKDKGLVNYHDQPLIEHVINRISPQVKGIIISCNRNFDTYRAYGFPLATDLGTTNTSASFSGPLAGIQAGLNKITTKAALIVPCDSPNIPEDLVKRLLAKLNEGQYPAVTAFDGKRLQPLFSLLSVAVKKPLDDYLNSGQRKVDAFFLQLPTTKVDFSDSTDHFLNLNTLESLINA